MTVDPPESLVGIPEDIAKSELPYFDKLAHTIRVASDTISYRDAMGGLHSVDIGAVNKQVWKEKLLKDLDSFAESLRKHED